MIPDKSDPFTAIFCTVLVPAEEDKKLAPGTGPFRIF